MNDSRESSSSSSSGDEGENKWNVIKGKQSLICPNYVMQNDQFCIAC